MADASPVSAPSGSTSSSSASEQARIRRERREAKIKAGGASRLNKITGLGGGLQRDTQPIIAPKPAAISHADPEEVDISEHYYQPAQNARPRNATPNPNQPYPGLQGDPTQINDEALRAMMLGFSSHEDTPQFGQPGAPNPFAAFGEPGANGTGDDPMMAMLQQMMAGGGAAPSFPGLPAMNLPGQQNPAAANPDPYAYVWRIVHAIFAIGLGLYVALTSEFNGTKLAREMSGLENIGREASYLFLTFEAVLQGTRFLTSASKQPPSGIFGILLPFLPPAWKSTIQWATRYLAILSTVSADLFLVVFIIGVSIWIK